MKDTFEYKFASKEMGPLEGSAKAKFVGGISGILFGSVVSITTFSIKMLILIKILFYFEVLPL